MSIEFKLNKPITVVTRAAETKTLDTISIIFYNDSVSERKLTVMIKEVSLPIVLWEGDEYTEIGQWTDDLAKARIVELLSK